jgi:uncharacterized phage-associated protein
MTLREQKILTAIKHFVKNTNNLGRTKLFKLLYFWDFRYFSKHGKSITGYDYITYPFGPVPDELFQDIIHNKLPKEFSENFVIEEDKDIDEDDKYKRFKIRLLKKDIDYGCLTKYELNELNEVVEIFKNCSAKDIVESTHLPNTPWSKTKEKGMNQIIDYFLAIDKDTPLDLEEIKERFELQKALTHNGYN